MKFPLSIGLAAFCIALAPAAFGACTIAKIAELSIIERGNQPIIEGRINGQPVKVMIDTGSASTVISEAAAKRLGLKLESADGLRIFGFGGEVRTGAAQLDSLQIGMFIGKNLRIAVVGRRGAPESHFDVLLGEDLMSRFTLELDLANQVVRFLRPEGCAPEQLVYWAKSYSVAELDREQADNMHIATTVTLGKIKTSAILDSGAYTSVVTRDAARRAGVIDSGNDSEEVRSSRGLNGSTIDTWVGTFDAFSIGDDETISNVKLRVGDIFGADTREETGSRIRKSVEMPSVVLGHDFLMAHRVVVLFKEHKLLLTYNGGAVFQTRAVTASADP
jgi:clan AA aspartic protease (TIGR02281 family)